jgi:hypothetical protein
MGLILFFVKMYAELNITNCSFTPSPPIAFIRKLNCVSKFQNVSLSFIRYLISAMIELVNNMPVKFTQMCVGTVERKFGHNVVGCSDDFTNLLITFSYENLSRMSVGVLMVGP